MGRSYSVFAFRTAERIRHACREVTGMTNTYFEAGNLEMFEVLETRHRDGRMEGNVFRYPVAREVRTKREARAVIYNDNVAAVPCGRFVILPDGTMPEGPAFMLRHARTPTPKETRPCPGTSS